MKITRHDGTAWWKCPISDRFFDSEAQQADFTATLIEQQGADLKLAERRAIYNAATAAL